MKKCGSGSNCRYLVPRRWVLDISWLCGWLNLLRFCFLNGENRYPAGLMRELEMIILLKGKYTNGIPCLHNPCSNIRLTK